jgi:hypothetical protein
MSLGMISNLVLILVGALLAGIGLSLMTDFRGSVTWWRESVARSRGVAPDAVFGGIPEKTIRLVVGGGSVAVGAVTLVIAAAHL